jgi:outer membrane lipoprotein
MFTTSCSVVSKQIKSESVPAAPFKTILDNTDVYLGKTIVLGGYVLETKKANTGTVLAVLQAPLGFRDKPKSKDQSEGRFIVFHSEFLDPEVYRNGREITVAGRVIGHTGPEDKNCPAKCLNLESREIYLWTEQKYYDPYPYYYYWPYPYFHYRHRHHYW